MRIASRGLIAVYAFMASGNGAIADDSVYLAMSNRIGLIEYCRANGHLSGQAAAVATARVANARAAMPPPASADASDKREQAGRDGLWGSRGIAAERQASTFGQTLAQYCAEQAE